MSQKFYARSDTRRVERNSAISFSSGGPFDCLGPFAKILNCPIVGTTLRRAAYASGYADTFFSVPASTRYKGRHVTGFFTSSEYGPAFNPHDKHKALFTDVMHTVVVVGTSAELRRLDTADLCKQHAHTSTVYDWTPGTPLTPGALHLTTQHELLDALGLLASSVKVYHGAYGAAPSP